MTTHDQTAHQGVRDIIDTAIEAAGANQLDDAGRFYAIAVPQDGDVKIIDVETLIAQAEDTLAPYKDRPRRKSGTYMVADVPSFVAYMSKHADENSEVWADQLGGRVTAVLDANEGLEGARWARHRLEYPARKTVEWLAWEALDAKMIGQEGFAEHIEDRLSDIIEPAAADMLELAQHFHATTDVQFDSSKRLADGQRQLHYKETTDATAGKAGDITIPERFYVALRPYEGSDAFKVECRFRYRMANGNLLLGFKMVRPEDILRESFDSLVAGINEGLNSESIDLRTPILLGTAPSIPR